MGLNIVLKNKLISDMENRMVSIAMHIALHISAVTHQKL